MSKWKTVEFVAENKAGAVDKMSLAIQISADGVFYTNVPDKLKLSFKDTDECWENGRSRAPKGTFTVSARTFADLERAIKQAHKLLMEPKITIEHVIRYNIESHVSFAVTRDGKIAPNAGYPDAEWPRDEKKLFGDHSANDRCQGGYSLTIGAEALTKKTITYGENSKCEYERYYKGESHLGHENPAQRLNSWVSFDLPEEAKEMPYSDEAALFFYNMMMTMAELNLRVQKFTHTPEKLALAIRGHSKVLLLEAPK